MKHVLVERLQKICRAFEHRGLGVSKLHDGATLHILICIAVKVRDKIKSLNQAIVPVSGPAGCHQRSFVYVYKSTLRLYLYRSKLNDT